MAPLHALDVINFIFLHKKMIYSGIHQYLLGCFLILPIYLRYLH